jgi:Protein of unknown function (DUF3443)/Abnormal spindle-like microcephaly-assoc'd, ASPM-SPD-2-Hydin/Cep192 domain 4
MTRRNSSLTILMAILALITASVFMPGCGGGSGSAATATTPGASLSVTSLTFTSPIVGTPSAGQTVTLSSSGTGTLTLSSIASSGDFTQTNNCSTSMPAGNSCVINVIFTPTASGARTGTLTVTDNASNSPQTVSLSGSSPPSTVSLSASSLTFATQTMVGTPSAAQLLTLNNIGTQALTVTGISATGDFTQTNTCGTSVDAGGSCTITVTFTPSAVGAETGTLTVTDDSNSVAGSTQTVALAGSGFTNNAADVNVNFGPNGPQGVPTATSVGYYNGIFTTVTICAPGTTTCATVPNVLVDTGSIGLRVLSDQLGSVALPSITDSAGDALYECVEYGDTSYSWGPVQLATVQIGGETASVTPGFGYAPDTGIPIQVITANGTAPSVAPCLSGGGPSNNSVAALGANGILGIANYAQDCGSGCTSSTTAVSPYPYILCTSTGSQCQLTPATLDIQLWNPVAAFSSADSNGVMLQLPSIPAAGQATVAGKLIFGIGTQTCPAGADAGCVPNTMGSAQTYALDGYGSFPSIQFKGVTYTSANNPGYLDSGSQALYISDAASLGISDCMVGSTNLFLYCPTPSPFTMPTIVLTGNNSVQSPPITLSIANALNLFNANPGYAAFNNLGGDSGSSSATDSFDFGLPFFFGKNIFVGIESTAYPNGYVAF